MADRGVPLRWPVMNHIGGTEEVEWPQVQIMQLISAC